MSSESSGFTFRHHLVSADLPIKDGWIGDYGQAALADIDRDGRLEFIMGRKRHRDWGLEGTIYGFRYEAPDRWTRHILGRDSLSDVGATVLDVDGDGWLDLVCGGVWYQNSRNPREKEFTRHLFDSDCEGAHDIVVADIDGDGQPEIVTMSDKKGLFWYKIPHDPTQRWEKHEVGPGIHGAFVPGGIADLDGDGDLDILCGDTWFENRDGAGRKWVAHRNIPFGRVGPFGMCVRTLVTDIDGDGRQEIVICDADIEDSKIAILRNRDGKGQEWDRKDLPQSFRYGSLHSLAVADFNGNGRLDIVSCEQEELLPEGRTNPQFILWENCGESRFVEHIILDKRLGGHELQVGDFNGDGLPDIISKPWGINAWNGAEGKMHVDYLENHSGKPHETE